MSNEQPNTAAIRADFGTRAPVDLVVRALCDALDATRTARDEWKANTLANEALYLKHFTRAEAAERHLADLQRDYDLMESERDAADDRRADFVRRALTEGTGQ